MTTERVLTVRQPWADLIMAGVKDVENRTWPVPSTVPLWYCCECGRRERGAKDVRLVRHYHARRARWHDMVPDGPFPFRLWIHAGRDFDQGWSREALAPGAHVLWHPVHGRAALVATKRLGALLGSVTVTGCHQTRDCIRLGAKSEDGYVGVHGCSRWADLGAESWHWTLTDPAPLPRPIPLRGRQGLWTLPDDVADQLARQGAA